MKAKLDIRVALPKLNLFRSRVENPSKELSSQIREMIPTIVAEIINENQLSFKAKVIERINAMDLKYKSENHKAKVMSVVEDFFGIVAASTQKELNALVGETDGEPGDQDPAEGTEAEPVKTEAKKPAKKDDEFSE